MLFLIVLLIHDIVSLLLNFFFRLVTAHSTLLPSDASSLPSSSYSLLSLQLQFSSLSTSCCIPPPHFTLLFTLPLLPLFLLSPLHYFHTLSAGVVEYVNCISAEGPWVAMRKVLGQDPGGWAVIDPVTVFNGLQNTILAVTWSDLS